MKSLKYFLIVTVVAITSLSLITPRTSRLSEAINPGDPIPDIKNLENISGNTISLSDLKGQKVLVNFWATYDASSRKNNILLSKLTGLADSPIKMVSVSFDKSKPVFEQTVANDEIDVNCQYYAQTNANQALVELYQLDGGFNNYLIDEEGVVLAVNLSPEKLSQLLN